jgi:hypothetical protein
VRTTQDCLVWAFQFLQLVFFGTKGPFGSIEFLRNQFLKIDVTFFALVSRK